MIFDDVRCEICGCTEEEACPGGCYWVEDPLDLMRDICSRCVEAASIRPWYPGMPAKGGAARCA